MYDQNNIINENTKNIGNIILTPPYIILYNC
uniref:Uncharacterized protein n=1 Tax=Podoviridae sp. ctPr92 TaxID=2825247 RepID=A0A8S5P898_9CAUD|nr:MAG TPA: hypothetical protein [Podoviridae sp. ctPr92]